MKSVCEKIQETKDIEKLIDLTMSIGLGYWEGKPFTVEEYVYLHLCKPIINSNPSTVPINLYK